MNFLPAQKNGVSKWITFSGRASRSEYWWIILGLFIFAMIYIGVAGIINKILPESHDLLLISFYILFFYCFFVSTSAGVRRLHDLGFSGWWYGGYIVLVRFTDKISEEHWAFDLIGALVSLVMIVFLIRKGETGPNKYGPDPLAVEPTQEEARSS